MVARLKSPQGPELLTSTNGTTWTSSALRLPFEASAIAYTGLELLRWTIAGQSNAHAFSPDLPGAWEIEEVAPMSAAPLRAPRPGAEGGRAAA